MNLKVLAAVILVFGAHCEAKAKPFIRVNVPHKLKDLTRPPVEVGPSPEETAKKAADVARKAEAEVESAKEKVTKAVDAIDKAVDQTKPKFLRDLKEEIVAKKKEVEAKEGKLEKSVLAAKNVAVEWLQFLVEVAEKDAYPEGYPAQKRDIIPNPSAEVFFSQSTVNAGFAELAREKISIGKDDYFMFEGARLTELNEKNIFALKVDQAKVKYHFVIDHSPHVGSATIEILPFIHKETVQVNKKPVDKYSLRFRGRCTDLSIDKCPPILEKVIAHVITRFIDTDAGTMGSFDISGALKTAFNLGKDSPNEVVAQIEKATVFTDNGGLKVQANLKPVKQPKPKKKEAKT